MVKATIAVRSEVGSRILTASQPTQISAGYDPMYIDFCITKSRAGDEMSQEIPYGTFAQDPNGIIGSAPLLYKDVGGYEHWYHDCNHLKGEGVIDGTELLNQFYPAIRNKSERVWIDYATGDCHHSRSGSWSTDSSTQYYEYENRYKLDSIELSKDKYALIGYIYSYTYRFYKPTKTVSQTWKVSFCYGTYAIDHANQKTGAQISWGVGNTYSSTVKEPSQLDFTAATLRAETEARKRIPSAPYQFTWIRTPEEARTYAAVKLRQLAKTAIERLPGWDLSREQVEESTLAEGQPPVPAWANLSAQALESYEGEFDGNGYAYMKDAKDLLPSFLSLKQSIFSSAKRMIPRKWLNTIAGAYLSVHYGFKLFARDTADLYEALRSSRDLTLKHLKAGEEYSRFEWDALRTYTIVFDQLPIAGTLLEFLDAYDLLFRAENAWDLVPYSFVVDWFADIQSSLSAMDTYANMLRHYNVVCDCKVTKATKVIDFDDVDGVSGSVRVTYFHRVIGKSVVPPDIFAASDPQGFSKKHALEAGALIFAH